MSKETTPRRRGRPSSVPEDKVLSTAFEEFCTRGFVAVSLRDIERLLGLSRNSLYQKYGSKDQLWYACVDYSFQKLKGEVTPFIDEVRSSDDPLGSLRNVVRAYLKATAAWPFLGRLMTLEGIEGGERLEYIFKNHSKDVMKPFVEVVQWLSKEGHVRPISMRALYFMVARGGSSPFVLGGLSACFDAVEGPLDEDVYMDEVSALIVQALAVPKA